MGEEVLRQSRTAMALARKVAQPIAIQAHERRFAARKKRGEQQQQS